MSKNHAFSILALLAAFIKIVKEIVLENHYASDRTVTGEFDIFREPVRLFLVRFFVTNIPFLETEKNYAKLARKSTIFPFFFDIRL